MLPPAAQMLGMSLASTGWLLAIVACSLPTWKVTASIGADPVTWKGPWTSCTGQMQCRGHDSVLALPPDLQAARGMTLLSVVTGVCGAVASGLGARCTRCLENERSKAKACVLAGLFFIISGSLCLVSVSWSARSTISGAAQGYELGAALYVGWAAAALLLTGGGLLCLNCPPKYEHAPTVPTFTAVRSITSKECV